MSYVSATIMSGKQIKTSELVGATLVGVLNGAIGGVAGEVAVGLKTTAIIATGVIAGVYTAVSMDEGTVEERISNGIIAGVTASTGTLLGTKFDTNSLSNGAKLTGNIFTATVVSTTMEIINVTAQNVVSKKNLSIAGKPLSYNKTTYRTFTKYQKNSIAVIC